MDSYSTGEIVTAGDSTVNGIILPIMIAYNPDGTTLYHGTKIFRNSSVTRDIIIDEESKYWGSAAILVNYFGSIPQNNHNKNTLISSPSNYLFTNPYTRYNTVSGSPDLSHYTYSGDVDVVGPSVARGPKRDPFRYSMWMVGTFTDSFRALGVAGIPDSILTTCPTFGKADCFIIRDAGGWFSPVRHQWGGPENDLAYDVASDDIGNATIFLRAGTPFPITSATRTLVNVQTGYNIVRLDTNGLLTETFPVALQATGEITDTQIALGKGGAVYILAKDEVKKQYFLAKVSRSGTVWIRYFPPAVADYNNYVPLNRTPRMGLITDSKDCAYITGHFHGTVDLQGASLSSPSPQVFVAKYSPSGSCLGALAMGSGCGVTVRLSPDETALYVNGWAEGRIMGTVIPSQDDPRNGIYRPGAFLVKLKLTK